MGLIVDSPRAYGQFQAGFLLYGECTAGCTITAALAGDRTDLDRQRRCTCILLYLCGGSDKSHTSHHWHEQRVHRLPISWRHNRLWTMAR